MFRMLSRMSANSEASFIDKNAITLVYILNELLFVLYPPHTNNLTNHRISLVIYITSIDFRTFLLHSQDSIEGTQPYKYVFLNLLVTLKSFMVSHRLVSVSVFVFFTATTHFLFFVCFSSVRPFTLSIWAAHRRQWLPN